jgi:hypothetical protein
MDNHHHLVRPVAARLFWSEYKLKLPAYWKLDPHSDRHRRHTGHLAPSWDDLILPRFDD